MEQCSYVDMKEGEEPAKSVLVNEKKPKYPYNLRLDLDAKQVQKLGLMKAPEVGEKLVLNAACEVVGVNKDESEVEGSSFRVSIQLMGIHVEMEKEEGPKEAQPAPAVKLYGGEKSSGSKA